MFDGPSQSPALKGPLRNVNVCLRYDGTFEERVMAQGLLRGSRDLWWCQKAKSFLQFVKLIRAFGAVMESCIHYTAEFLHGIYGSLEDRALHNPPMRDGQAGKVGSLCSQVVFELKDDRLQASR